jgi:hypothetical protein
LTASGGQITVTLPALPCGEVIGIPAGKYIGITIDKLIGCEGNPVILTNQGGVVEVDARTSGWGISILEARHAVIRSATPGTYGFKVISNGGGVRGIKVEGIVDGLDVSGLHAVGTENGILSIITPTCDPNTWFPTAYQKNINYHDNLIEDTVSEGMYIGYANNGTITKTCNGSPVTLKAARGENIKIFNNTTKNTGNEGIKLRLCHGDCEIYNNYVYNYGKAQQNGIWCLGLHVGSETAVNVHHNTIEYGHCSALDIRSEVLGVQKIHHNTVRHAGTMASGAAGIWWAGALLLNFYTDGQTFEVTDNDFSDSRKVDVEITNLDHKSGISGVVCRSGASTDIPSSVSVSGCP